jgi:metal-responsive CopG/Arc/MetJ family transcriptional regulator
MRALIGPYMPRVSADISDELNRRLKQYIITHSGKLRGGQSEFIAKAIEMALDAEETKT